MVIKTSTFIYKQVRIPLPKEINTFITMWQNLMSNISVIYVNVDQTDVERGKRKHTQVHSNRW